jgi:ubiquinone/menaquinone biosynthesis C-methylase UbiE
VGFDRLARPYRLLERAVFGDRLQRARCAHMESFLEAKQILLLGEGDGRFLEALLAEGCRAEIVCLDASIGMLDLAEERAGEKGSGVRFLAGDVRNLRLPQEFRPDVVSAHFFLDCFREEELLDIVESIACGSIPGGKVVVTDFKLPEGGWVWRLRGRLLIFLMLLFFRVFAGISARKLPDLCHLLTKQGWNCRKEAIFDNGLVFSRVMELPANKRS